MEEVEEVEVDHHVVEQEKLLLLVACHYFACALANDHSSLVEDHVSSCILA